MTSADQQALADMRKTLGQEIRQHRLAKGISTLKEMGRRTGLSAPYLSQIERAYEHPSLKPTLPSDKTLTKIAEVIDLPLRRMQMILRRIPEDALTLSPEANLLAEQFDRLPPSMRRIVQDAMRTAQAMVEQADKEMGETRNEPRQTE